MWQSCQSAGLPCKKQTWWRRSHNCKQARCRACVARAWHMHCGLSSSRTGQTDHLHAISHTLGVTSVTAVRGAIGYGPLVKRYCMQTNAYAECRTGSPDCTAVLGMHPSLRPVHGIPPASSGSRGDQIAMTCDSSYQPFTCPTSCHTRQD